MMYTTIKQNTSTPSRIARINTNTIELTTVSKAMIKITIEAMVKTTIKAMIEAKTRITVRAMVKTMIKAMVEAKTRIMVRDMVKPTIKVIIKTIVEIVGTKRILLPSNTTRTMMNLLEKVVTLPLGLSYLCRPGDTTQVQA